MNARLDWISAPASALHGEIEIPGDKSVSHRAIMLAAIAEGRSRIHGFLEGADTHAGAAIFEQLGVRIETPAPGERIVHGAGLHGLRAPGGVLDCGNSGTAMRLLTGLFAGQSFDCTLVGDASLSRRPMRRITEPLGIMGARIEAAAGELPPLRIRGRPLHGMEYTVPIASAQVKSALLLAGLYARGATCIREPQPTRDYTERMLAAFGWPIEFEAGRVKLDGGRRLHATEVAVPADFSSAAFFIVAATLIPGSELRLRGVGLNPRRTGLLRVLRAMGADIIEENPRESGGESIADLLVRQAPLRATEMPALVAPDMIDEFPILFVAATGAQGTTMIRGAQELRVKESDRIAVMASGLRALGARIEETADGAIIQGGGLQGGEVDAQGDHRCAMAFAVAGAITREPVRIRDCANVATSFPGFAEKANGSGMRVEIVPGQVSIS
ncbi:MAG TPA: 3-phosphoshikimate 1-carboxyvinyltransferase [Rhodanobacteraceae bacterium]|nr:3-phosphoshikimate 1-carboxyvinyltransferase [Rhodanobacteraceae bacterium]